jgi:hypothetical protein
MIGSNSISGIIKSPITVQPVPAPCSTNAEDNNNINEGGNNQNDILFNLGNRFVYK